MTNILTVSPPAPVMFILTLVAGLCIAYVIRRGHFVILVPTAISMWWMSVGYLAFTLGIIDDDTRISMLRNGIAVIAVTVVVGAILYARRRDGDRPDR